MNDTVTRLLNDAGITLVAPLPLSVCRVTRPYMLERESITSGTVFMTAVPYFSRALLGKHNISAYCAVQDYHIFFRGLWNSIICNLKEKYPENRFCGFADSSPIDERDAAARAGLGIIGRNGMLITRPYSSFVFLGELITDAVCDCPEVQEPVFCENCGMCKNACPTKNDGNCLSALTQKKGTLDKNETETIRKNNSVWGCDVCQTVCPHTKKAISEGTIYTDIRYFSENVIPDLSLSILNATDDEAFMSRAFSWRGRETVLRNLSITERNHQNNIQ